MRSTVAVAMMVAGIVLMMPSCMKLDFFKRRENPRLAPSGACVGAPAPAFEGEDLDGKRVKLSDYRGKVVVLVFWFSRCPPCKAMIPHERELVERYRDKPFAMIGVYGDVDYEEARKIIAAQHMTWPIVKGTAGADAITRRYGVESFPSVFVVDANGVVRASGVTGPALDSAVAALLADMETKRR